MVEFLVENGVVGQWQFDGIGLEGESFFFVVCVQDNVCNVKVKCGSRDWSVGVQ